MRLLLSLLIIIAFVGCTGAEGPIGPAGPQGEQGLPGEDGTDGEDGAGTRVVYTSATPVPSMAVWCLDIPQITLNDMPLVAVYAAPETDPTMWTELPLYTENVLLGTMFYVMSEGEVCVESCAGYWIRIVLVV